MCTLRSLLLFLGSVCLFVFSTSTFAIFTSECSISDALGNPEGDLGDQLNVVQKIEARLGQRVFFSNEMLRLSSKSLNTYCCERKEDCNPNFVFGDGEKNPIASMAFMDHFLSLFDAILEGNEQYCQDRDKNINFTCQPHLYQENKYPGPGVCLRNGTDTESGGNADCESVYGVKDGIDTKSKDTQGALPSVIHGTYEKFNSFQFTIHPSKVTPENLKTLSLRNLGYIMCQEAEVLYQEILSKSSSAGISDGGNVFQECLRVVDKRIKNVDAYVRSTSLSTKIRNYDVVNSAYQDNHVYGLSASFKDTLNELTSGLEQMMHERDQYTKTC